MVRGRSTGSAAYRILRRKQNCFEIHLAGDLEVSDIEELETRFMAALDEEKVRTPQVILNLGELTQCSVQARHQLARLQRRLASIGARTSYVTQVPRFRGVGLWVATNAADPNARAFPTHRQAESWLDSRETRHARATERWNRAYTRRNKRGADK